MPRSYDIVKTTQDLTRLAWQESGLTSGSGGTFLKAREGIGAEAVYYKLSCYDAYRGIYGHESINELVASRLMSVLDVPHAPYRLVHAEILLDDKPFTTWLAKSESFRAPGERKQALDLFYGLNRREGESPLELCERYGWGSLVRKMMLVDYLVANRDRHGANIEVLRDQQGQVRLAPFFDNGLSLVFSCYDDEKRIRAFDPLEDVRANNYLGTRSLEENVRLFALDVEVPSLSSQHRGVLLAGLDGVLPAYHLEKIWQIIWERWCRFEDLRNLQRG